MFTPAVKRQLVVEQCPGCETKSGSILCVCLCVIMANYVPVNTGNITKVVLNTFVGVSMSAYFSVLFFFLPNTIASRCGL